MESGTSTARRLDRLAHGQFGAPVSSRVRPKSSMSVRLERALTGARPERQAGHQAPHAIIKEELFKSVLVREQLRADRSELPLLVLELFIADDGLENAASIWSEVIEALGAAKRETDVLGWFEKHSVLGLIFLEIQGTAAAVAADLEARIWVELRKRLPSPVIDRISVRFQGDPTLTRRPQSRRERTYERIKRGMDVCGSLALLLVLSPLFLLIAALVKLTSRGPVFFRQVRVGDMGQPFKMLKFRSMHANVDPKLHQEYVTWFIQSSDKAKGDNGDTVFKLTADPRVTKIGGFLRKTSLDELPQFLNVLRGEMSLVGPRPPLPYEVEQYKRWHHRRVLDAKPGITGLWQVTGRSRTTFDEMVRLDIRYAKNCSLQTDLKILFATPAAVIAGKGAC
jgi:lipopolysaccharide/colanic/teichoic acid biosynthesis glycosyltransferase